MTEFHRDLRNEQRLAVYLDGLYPKLLPHFHVERVSDLRRQMEGCDIVISKADKVWCVDEKAQLDYLNKRLPTFAFELSYIKNGNRCLGWLLDDSKKTDHYFLITAICTDSSCGDFKACKIMSVDRVKLIDWLNSKGLSSHQLLQIDEKVRRSAQSGRVSIVELNEKSEGYFHFSKANKSEQPINLVLRLKVLEAEGIGKVLV